MKTQSQMQMHKQSRSNDMPFRNGANAEVAAAGGEVQLHEITTPTKQYILHRGHIDISSLDTAGSSSSSQSPSHQQAHFQLPTAPEPAHLSPLRSHHPPPPLTSSSLTLNECCAPAPAQAPRPQKKMGLTKTQRIGILLAIDSAFFLVEIIVGYAVHSLALVADSFHMLNDVLSLCVGLWAVRVANSGSSKTYTYGWQRAETLGALVNGVFLVALCLSIFLEAIQRFVEPQIVTNPKLVLIVGCLGLGSNILGLFLFHDHGHSHGGADESHSHAADPISTAEQGHSHAYQDEATRQVQDQTGSIADVLPQVKVAGYKPTRKSGDFSKSDEDTTTLGTNTTAPTRRTTVSSPEATSRHRRRTSGSFGRGFGSVDSIHIHPASFRNDIIQAARLEERPESESGEEEALLEEDGSPNENSRILSNANGTSSPKKDGYTTYGSIAKRRTAAHSHSHDNHNHSQPKDSSQSHGGHGHSHGDLNMRGVFLHVLGDALGNIGVIASALIIWLTTFKGRYYFDPGISLVITVIILWSAIPLCKAASRILLQAVPVGMSIDEIRHDIEALDRVLEAHHLHVWQLSDTKLVASLHVKVDCEVEGSGSGSYMHLAREIRRCLHGYGIHSSTIQPEFTTGTEEAAIVEATDETGAISPGTGLGGNNSKAGSLMEGGRCLLDCEDECGSDSVCCPPQSNPSGSVDGNGNGNGKGK